MNSSYDKTYKNVCCATDKLCMKCVVYVYCLGTYIGDEEKDMKGGEMQLANYMSNSKTPDSGSGDKQMI